MDPTSPAIEQSFAWYAVRVRTGREKKIADALTRKGPKECECLVPTYREKRKWSDRTKVLELPIFPGYVFFYFDIDVRLPVMQTPGVIEIVGIGKIPQALDSREMEHIRSVTRVGHPARPSPFLKTGQRVRITAGPLTGVEGILTKRRGELLVVLSVSMLEKALSVVVESDSVRPV